MQEETVLVSLRIPKKMDNDIGYAVKSEGYASRTELMREAIRDRIYKNLDEMRGALKGKVKVTGTMRQWRKKQWENALKRANGDHHKAYEILKKDEQEAIKDLKF